jgi:GR25 family glycosyltransferase involved in LPS biosynthesis
LKNKKTSDSHHPRVGNIPADINEVFPYKVCINLDRRAGRWKQMQAKFNRHGIQSVRRFAAVDGQQAVVPPNWSTTPGAYGCLLSHLEVVRAARELNMPSVLILEDDAAFDPHLQDNFSAYFRQVPPNWDMLHFGVMHTDEPTEVSENVLRIRSANSTFAYALKHTIFDCFIELNSQAQTAVDLNNRILQKEHRCYCFTPHLAWVEDDCSDAQERQKYHWYLKESLVLHGSGMDQLLHQTAVIIVYRNSTRSESIAENLLFLARFYTERLPGISVVIVEQDAKPTLSLTALPEGCQYLFLRNDGPLNKGFCLNAGMNLSDSKRSFLIFSDSDIFVEEWDIRGNLRMCQQYDCTTGFRSMVELTNTATRQLQSNRPMLLTPWFNAEEYSRCDKNDHFGKYCVFQRRSIEAAGGWEDQRPEKTASILSLKAGQQLRVFESPNDALRLVHD